MSMTKRQLIDQLASYQDTDPVLIEHNNQQWEVQQVHAVSRQGGTSDTGAKGGEATSTPRMIGLQAGQPYKPTGTGSQQSASPSQKT